MTFAPIDRHSYAKQSEEAQRRDALSYQPLLEQEQENAQMMQWLAANREGQDLAALATAINPSGELAKVGLAYAQRQELRKLADQESEKFFKEAEGISVVTLDQLREEKKEISTAMAADYEVANLLRKQGADPIVVDSMANSQGQKRYNIANSHLQTLTEKAKNVKTARLKDDERLIQIEGLEPFHINGNLNPVQYRAAVHFLIHEFNQNEGIYGITPILRMDSGYSKAIGDLKTSLIGEHEKRWELDSDESRRVNGLEYAISEVNLAESYLDTGKAKLVLNGTTLVNSFIGTKDEKGDVLTPKQAIDEIFKRVESIADYDIGLAEQMADQLALAEYDKGGEKVPFSKERVEKLRDAILVKVTGKIDRELSEKERDREILTRDWEQGNITDEEYQAGWTQLGQTGLPAGMLRRQANEAASAGDQKTQILASIKSTHTLGMDLTEVHPENYEWAKEQFDKLNKFSQAKNHSDANGSIKIIDGRISTITGWAGTDRLAGEIGPTVSLMAKRDFYNELKQFTLDGLPIHQAIDEARKKVLERLGNPETPDELEKGYYYRLSQVSSGDAYSVASFKMGELGKENLDFTKPWTGENAPDVGFLRELPTSDIADIAGYVGPDYKGKTPEIVNILYKKWEEQQPLFPPHGIDSKDFARRLAEGLGISVAPPTPKETKIKKAVKDATKDNELISSCIRRCTDNPSPGAAFNFKTVLQLEKNLSVANSNELLAWDYS